MTPSLLLFDSGIGGLSIFNEVQALLPHESIIYLADQAYCPYGQKSVEQIQFRVVSLLNQIHQQYPLKLIVIACNTATTVGIDHYRTKIPNVPIVGVVPVIKKAAEVTKTKQVLVIATERTINNHYVNQLIEKFGQGVTFNLVGDKNGELVGEIENIQDTNSKYSKKEIRSQDSEIINILNNLLSPFRKLSIDTIVLGCTHFPFIRDEIREAWGSDVQILDSGGAVARQVKRKIQETSYKLQEGNAKYVFYTTGDPVKFSQQIKIFTNLARVDVERI